MAETATMTSYVGTKRKKKKKPSTVLNRSPLFNKRHKTGGTKHSVASGGSYG